MGTPPARWARAGGSLRLQRKLRARTAISVSFHLHVNAGCRVDRAALGTSRRVTGEGAESGGAEEEGPEMGQARRHGRRASICLLCAGHSSDPMFGSLTPSQQPSQADAIIMTPFTGEETERLNSLPVSTRYVVQPVLTHHDTLPLDWTVAGDLVEFSVDWGGGWSGGNAISPWNTFERK